MLKLSRNRRHGKRAIKWDYPDMADNILEYFDAAGYRTDEQAFLIANVAMLFYRLRVQPDADEDLAPLAEIGDFFRDRIIRLDEEHRALRQLEDESQPATDLIEQLQDLERLALRVLDQRLAKLVFEIDPENLSEEEKELFDYFQVYGVGYFGLAENGDVSTEYYVPFYQHIFRALNHHYERMAAAAITEEGEAKAGHTAETAKS